MADPSADPTSHSLTYPSPILATGIIAAEFGIDRATWDSPVGASMSLTQTERIFSTIMIRKGSETWPLDYAPVQLDSRTLTLVDPLGGWLPLEDFLQRRLFNNGLLVMHQGRVIHESYRNNLTPQLRHINMSTTKSFVGMLAGIAIGDGLLNPDDLMTLYVSELQGKDAWHDVTVRHVMDMRDGIRFDEFYDDPRSDIWSLSRAIGWWPPLDDTAAGARAWVARHLNEKVYPAGSTFKYASIQSDLLGMALETVYHQPLAELFAQKLYSQIGAEQDAGFGTDGYGFALAEGALSLTLRDFARCASLALLQGVNWKGQQLIPRSFFEDLVTPQHGLSDAFARSRHRDLMPGGHYRSQFWVLNPARQRFQMSGVHGQMAYIDLPNQLLIVAYGAYPLPDHPLLSASLTALVTRLTSLVT